MKITILALGTRGDLQPHVALGIALQGAGYDVRIATASAFRHLVAGHGLAFAPVEISPDALLASEAGQRWLQSGGHPLRFIRTWREFTRAGRAAYEQALVDAWQACQDANAVIYSGAFVAGHFIARRLDVPEIWTLLHPLPLLPTRDFPAVFAPEIPALGAPYKRATHTLFEFLFWQALREANERWRQAVLGLPPLRAPQVMGLMRRSGVPALHAYSPLVGHVASDWPESVHVTGYWFLDQPDGWQPPAALVDFLAAGEPPVYVGFGSMAGADPQEELDVVLAALRESGQRGILASSAAAADLPDDVFAVDSVPHCWLFPRVAAAVHHGGAGTTAASLRAGIPTVVVPFFLDQPYWGRRVHALGAGPRPIARQKLSAGRLAEALRATQDPAIRARAAELGHRMRAEDGLARAVEIIDRHLGK